MRGEPLQENENFLGKTVKKKGNTGRDAVNAFRPVLSREKSFFLSKKCIFVDIHKTSVWS